jgi:hypothetical protein
MKVVYYCYGRAHSSVTAANLHLGNLPMDRRPAPGEIMHQPLFDRAEDYEVGEFRLMGTDEWGHAIYVVGLAGGREAMARGMRDFLRVAGVDDAELLLEDALISAGVLLRIGGYSSRRLGWIWFGRRLCALGVWLNYSRFVAHVRRVRQAAARR